ncbi:MAG: hypothetical protein UHM85_04480, partial [Acutalibacteraceae bacterium]|nr:hypothetical protein [Acutalibacteraceae bacterium]
MALIMVFSVTFTNSAMAIESTSNDKATPVAIIGTEEFKTLQDAVNAANGGETVTLLSDVEMSNILVIDKSITLDGN